MESAAEIAIGVGVELFMGGLAAAVVYRLFAGRFLIPKREMVLPNQRGVLVHGDRQVREVGPGRIWVRPGRKLLLCDVRPRKLQIEGFDLLTSDGAVLRSSVGGQYSISNAMTFLSASGNAGDALYFDLRRLLTTVAREHSSFAITSAREVFIQQVKDRLNRAVAPTGLEVSQLECWDLVQRGWMQHPGEPVIDGGMVH